MSNKANSTNQLYNDLLTAKQRNILDADDAAPRWDLEPPQREEFLTDRDYVLALGRYADRIQIERKGQQK
jgi:hypothetical protein